GRDNKNNLEGTLERFF
ncbi:unnamed protein product, partial [Allacma fusca]